MTKVKSKEKIVKENTVKETKPENMRIDRNDLINCITFPKGEDPEVATRPTVIRYDSEGKTQGIKGKILDDNEACAVEVTTGRQKVYKVKSRRGGDFYNPLHSGMVYGLHIQDRVNGGLMFKFREVNQRAFECYVKFLQTKYDSFLNMAEREK